MKGNKKKSAPIFQISLEDEAKIITAVLALERMLKTKINELLSEYYKTDDWMSYEGVFKENGYVIRAVKYLQKEGVEVPETQDIIQKVSFGFWNKIFEMEFRYRQYLINALFPEKSIRYERLIQSLRELILHRNFLMHAQDPENYPLKKKLRNHYTVLKMMKLISPEEEKKYTFLFHSETKPTSLLERVFKNNSPYENQIFLRKITSLSTRKEPLYADLYEGIIGLENTYHSYSQGLSVFNNPMNAGFQLLLIESSHSQSMRKRALVVSSAHVPQPLMTTFMEKINHSINISEYTKNLLEMLNDVKLSKNLKVAKSIFLSLIECYELINNSFLKIELYEKIKNFIRDKILKEIDRVKNTECNLNYMDNLKENSALAIALLILYSGNFQDPEYVSTYDQLKEYLISRRDFSRVDFIQNIILEAIKSFILPEWPSLHVSYQVQIAGWISQVLPSSRLGCENLGFSILSPLVSYSEHFKNVFLSIVINKEMLSIHKNLAEILDIFDFKNLIIEAMIKNFDSYATRVKRQIISILIYSKAAAESFTLFQYVMRKIDELSISNLNIINALIFLYRKTKNPERQDQLLDAMKNFKNVGDSSSGEYVEFLFESNKGSPAQERDLAFKLLTQNQFLSHDEFLLNYFVSQQDIELVRNLKKLIFKPVSQDDNKKSDQKYLFERHYFFISQLCIQLQDPFLVKKFVRFLLKERKNKSIEIAKKAIEILLFILDGTPHLEVAHYISRRLQTNYYLLDNIEDFYEKMSRPELLKRHIKKYFLNEPKDSDDQMNLVGLSEQVLLNKHDFLGDDIIQRAIETIVLDLEKIKKYVDSEIPIFDFIGMSHNFLNSLNALAAVDRNKYPVDWKRINSLIEWSLKAFKNLEDLMFEFHLLYVAGSIQDEDMLKIILKHVESFGYSNAVIEIGKKYFSSIKQFNVSHVGHDIWATFFNPLELSPAQNNVNFTAQTSLHGSRFLQR
ncbi:MAG: hypothetical protein JSS53_02770 [Proteobacteria bacterium]|nr:hypothetical protein [Pseudomonadota bacterium]